MRPDDDRSLTPRGRPYRDSDFDDEVTHPPPRSPAALIVVLVLLLCLLVAVGAILSIVMS